MLCCVVGLRKVDGDKEGAPQEEQQQAAHKSGKADGSVCVWAELEALYASLP